MSKKIRVGMIGYGFMGKAHTNAFRQASKFFPELPYEPELKMFCARNEDRATQFASNWGYEKVVTDWKELIENTKLNNGADRQHTLNTLDLMKEDGLAHNAAGDQLRGDIFFRIKLGFVFNNFNICARFLFL